MAHRLVDKVRMKVALWINKLPGKTPAADSKGRPTKKPYESLEPSRNQAKGTRGRGDQRETPHRIEEFFPRGSAGRREVRGPSGPRKAAMPRQGNRSRNPK